MTTSIRTSSDGLSSIISINGVDKLTVDQNGKVTATKFAGDGSELTGLIKSGTAINTTSGTAHDFTGIPAGVKRITIMLSGVSTNGSSTFILRLGSGAIQASGYASGASIGTAAAQASDGFVISANQGPTGIYYGSCVLTLMAGNTWVLSSNVIAPISVGTSGAGAVTLTGGIDRVRLTTGNGTDLFDAGSVNILYE